MELKRDTRRLSYLLFGRCAFDCVHSTQVWFLGRPVFQHRLIAQHARTLGDDQGAGRTEYSNPLFVAMKPDPVGAGSSISTDKPFCRPTPL